MCEPITLGVLASAGAAAGASAAGATALTAASLAATVGAGVMSASSSYQQGQVAKVQGLEAADEDGGVGRGGSVGHGEKHSCWRSSLKLFRCFCV